MANVPRYDDNQREALYLFSILISFMGLALLALMSLRFTGNTGMRTTELGIVMVSSIPLLLSWSKKIASKICQLAGLSLARREVEVLGPFTASSEEAGALPKVKLRRGASAYIIPVCSTALVYIFTSSLLQYPHSQNPNIAVQVLLIAVIGAMALMGWKNLKKPEFHTDHDIIGGFPIPLISYISIEWSAVGSCEFTKIHDVLGRDGEKSLVFKNRVGKRLLKLSMRPGTEKMEQKTWEQFVDFVRAKQVRQASSETAGNSVALPESE